MNVLIVGSGGREHAIAWKVKRSPKLINLYVLPGNPGTAALAEKVTGISVDDHAAIVAFCRDKQIDLVIVGPEAPLAAGLADSLSHFGWGVFAHDEIVLPGGGFDLIGNDVQQRSALLDHEGFLNGEHSWLILFDEIDDDLVGLTENGLG